MLFLVRCGVLGIGVGVVGLRYWVGGIGIGIGIGIGGEMGDGRWEMQGIEPLY